MHSAVVREIPLPAGKSAGFRDDADCQRRYAQEAGLRGLTLLEDPAPCSEVSSLNRAIRLPMRLVWRVERDHRGRVRRPAPILRRRLPGLLQAERAAD